MTKMCKDPAGVVRKRPGDAGFAWRYDGPGGFVWKRLGDREIKVSTYPFDYPEQYRPQGVGAITLCLYEKFDAELSVEEARQLARMLEEAIDIHTGEG